MKIICFGSINMDLVYGVDHIPVEGETILSNHRNMYWGGKGLNQAVALAKSFEQVYLAGYINKNEKDVIDYMKQNNINTEFIAFSDNPTGHAIIHVDKQGQNSITVFGGSNHDFTKDRVKEILDCFGSGDIVLIQNETNGLKWIIDYAYEKGMDVAINPSPFHMALNKLPLNKVKYFLYNEIEAMQIAEEKEFTDEIGMLTKLTDKYKNATHVLTLGSKGVVCAHDGSIYRNGAYKVVAVDTTAAGDTFTGYFLSQIAQGKGVPQALEIGSKAAAIAVSRAGATTSIPSTEEVASFHQSLA